jgi:hypothetical protein
MNHSLFSRHLSTTLLTVFLLSAVIAVGTEFASAQRPVPPLIPAPTSKPKTIPTPKPIFPKVKTPAKPTRRHPHLGSDREVRAAREAARRALAKDKKGLKPPVKATKKRAKKQVFSARASCKVLGYKPVSGIGTGSTKAEACENAIRNARTLAPRGTFPYDCKCK